VSAAGGAIDGLVTGAINRRLPHLISAAGVPVPVLVIDVDSVCEAHGMLVKVAMPDPTAIAGVDLVDVPYGMITFVYPDDPMGT
jgi:hypothetical protein